MAGLVPAIHEDVRIDSAISALGGREVSSTSIQNRPQINPSCVRKRASSKLRLDLDSRLPGNDTLIEFDPFVPI
jgi:hypothetical protein